MAFGLAEISPLRGVRFSRPRSGPVGPLLAPPYDVATGGDTENALSISRIENVTVGGVGDQHAIAASRYRDWLKRGILHVDETPAIYVHRHQYVDGDRTRMRTGLLARVRLRDWGDGVILPHERTTPGPRAERLDRLRAVHANLSPLYMLFRDLDRDATRIIDGAAPAGEGIVERDRVGGLHQLTAMTDSAVISALQSFFADKTLFVADGHHRYEAALAYRDEQRARNPGIDGPWEHVLVLLAAVDDPGVEVRPTHRLVQANGNGVAHLIDTTVDRWFELRATSGEDDPASEGALFRLLLPEDKRQWAVHSRTGDPHRFLLPATRGLAWQSLDVSAVEGVLDAVRGRRSRGSGLQVIPVIDDATARRAVATGEASAAFLLAKPRVSRLLEVAERGDPLPAKSTWFEPKAPAGLVIYDFELSAPD